MAKKGRISLPSSTVRANGFDYEIVQSSYKSENHGETCRDNKQIFFSPQDKLEILQDTFIHENLHALLEDILESIDSIEKTDEKEEQLVRLLTPRLRAWICDNREWVKWLWKKKSY
jgi:hypothetical protein